MGNHAVGQQMAAVAKMFFATYPFHNPPKADALEALEIGGNDFIGADAEFDDELLGPTELSKLVEIAFDATPEEIEDRDTGDGLLWHNGPETRFREHFKFC